MSLSVDSDAKSRAASAPVPVPLAAEMMSPITGGGNKVQLISSCETDASLSPTSEESSSSLAVSDEDAVSGRAVVGLKEDIMMAGEAEYPASASPEAALLQSSSSSPVDPAGASAGDVGESEGSQIDDNPVKEASVQVGGVLAAAAAEAVERVGATDCL